MTKNIFFKTNQQTIASSLSSALLTPMLDNPVVTMENGTMYTDSSLRVMTGVNEQAASKDMYCDNWKSGVASMNVGTPLDTDRDWFSCEC